MTNVTIPARFNGPPTSGQGGYSCALLAARLEGPAAVSLRRPVPLDEELEVRLEDGGARAFDAAGELIAEAVSAPPLAPWEAPMIDLDAAHRAKSSFVAPPGGTFDRCFVCGLDRHDGFGVFSGPVEGTDLVASPWTPPKWSADSDGAVLPEFVWAALDCPGYFALHGTDMTLAFLARQQSEVLAPVRAGVDHLVVGRPIERSGRKGLAATAILDPDGEVVAHAELLIVVPREAMSHE
ncbi:MAG TPA: hypothetical protein VHZ54_12745 [Solirubrobacterales bacterium]|nr:hypothetical protein [Solirubrobacterales bacterium]